MVRRQERTSGRGRRITRRGFLAAGLALAAAPVLGHSVALAAPTQPSGPITASRFSIAVDGHEVGSFAELSGITSEIQQSEYWETGGDIHVNKLPGRVKQPTLVLKRGLGSSLAIFQWHQAAREGRMGAARRSCTLTMFNAEGRPVARYWLENAWPSKVELAGLKAGSSEAPIETVTFVCDYLQRLEV
jgi:phage tail-like protein